MGKRLAAQAEGLLTTAGLCCGWRGGCAGETIAKTGAGLLTTFLTVPLLTGRCEDPEAAALRGMLGYEGS